MPAGRSRSSPASSSSSSARKKLKRMRGPDGIMYNVLDGRDSEATVNQLARLNQRVLFLIDFLDSQYPDVYVTKNLKKRYNPEKFSEGVQYAGDGISSYTVGKAEMSMCVRDKVTLQRYNDNLLMNVILHELAHMASQSFVEPGKRHNEEFKENFKFLKDVAADIGVYRHIDFNKHPVSYCEVYMGKKKR